MSLRIQRLREGAQEPNAGGPDREQIRQPVASDTSAEVEEVP
jgi:hypothetical protein